MIEIDAMAKVTAAGAIILPLAPGFYLRPRSIEDLLDFMVARMLDLFAIEHDLKVRWDEHLAARKNRGESE